MCLTSRSWMIWFPFFFWVSWPGHTAKIHRMCHTASKSMSANWRCVLWLQVQGPTLERHGQLRIHPRDVQGRPHELVLKESAKYLGSILHVGANNKDELRNRVTQANTVHGRLTPRVCRSSSIPLPLKIRLWQTLVLTKGLYAVEIRVLGRADLLYLERWQIKKLRHLARGPVHITRETSEALRRRVQIPTIQSQLRVRRLKWWRQLLAPRFAATARDRIEQGHTWVASLAIRTALLGTFSFETNPPQTTERQRQLLDDAKELVQIHERTQRTAILKCPMRFPMNSWDGWQTYPMKICLSSTDTILPWTWLVNRPSPFPALSVVAPFVESRGSPRVVEASTVLQCKSFQVRHVRGARKHFPHATTWCTIAITIAANGTHHCRSPVFINDTSNIIWTVVISIKIRPVHRGQPTQSLLVQVLLEWCRMILRHPRMPSVLLNLVVWLSFWGIRLPSAREMSMPFRKPPFQKSTDKLALTLTVQTDPLQHIRF